MSEAPLKDSAPKEDTANVQPETPKVSAPTQDTSKAQFETPVVPKQVSSELTTPKQQGSIQKASDPVKKKDRKSLYFAGGMFTHKELIGNALLATALENASKKRYKCIAPQNLVQNAEDSSAIKNNDLQGIVETDGCLINFDGNELDSGTVVELIAAKFLDKPVVLYRTDFRSHGITQNDGWNLMCQNYPRTENFRQKDLMIVYHQIREKYGGDYTKVASELTYHLADALAGKLDSVFSTDPTKRVEGLTDDMI